MVATTRHSKSISRGYHVNEHDSLLRNNYVRARHYDPIIGRWLSEDPLHFALLTGEMTVVAKYLGRSFARSFSDVEILTVAAMAGWTCKGDILLFASRQFRRHLDTV